MLGDRLLATDDRDVGISAPYHGVARMTLTLRVLDAARHRLWLVTGADKAAALKKLWVGDAWGARRACRFDAESAFIFADAAAAGVELPAEIRSPPLRRGRLTDQYHAFAVSGLSAKPGQSTTRIGRTKAATDATDRVRSSTP